MMMPRVTWRPWKPVRVKKELPKMLVVRPSPSCLKLENSKYWPPMKMLPSSAVQSSQTRVPRTSPFWTAASASTIVSELTAGSRIDYLICDEVQFYTGEQVEQLARIVDELDIDVFGFGILTDFRTRLFEGSARMVELADRVETLQVQVLCWCGRRATHNARTVDGLMVVEGAQVVVGDTTDLGANVAEGAAVAYEVLCRRHHRSRKTRLVAHAGLAETLPFEPGPTDERNG